MLCRLPKDVAGVLVESDNARVVGAADVQEHGVSFDERRADHAVPFFGDAEFLACIDSPDFCARVQIEAVEDALSSKCVSLCAVDSGSGSRSIIEMDAVAERAQIIEAPERLARLGVEALDDLLLLEAMDRMSLPAEMTGALKPWPTGSFQRTFGPSFGHAGAMSVP